MSLRSAVIGFVIVWSFGCEGAQPPLEPPFEPCPIGDPAAPAELSILHLDATFVTTVTTPMARVPLIEPEQGGWIVLLGIRARNLDGCRLTLTTALVDVEDDQIIKIDQRPATLELQPDGWGISTTDTFSNLQVCPQLTATRDLNELPYIVRVLAEDADGKRAEASITVVPTCAPDASRCVCDCDRDHVVGAECPMMPAS